MVGVSNADSAAMVSESGSTVLTLQASFSVT
jgi:hypothetical protein